MNKKFYTPIIIFIFLLTNFSFAQIPDQFTNLQLLSKDINKRELINIMRNFAGSLGVRCNYCHAGKEGMEASPNDLSTIDFASDKIPAKDITRVMMKMTANINDEHLTKISEHSQSVSIACETCHKGMPAPPEKIEGILFKEINEKGGEAAFNKYKELREKYYGNYVYNFSFKPLTKLSENIRSAKKNSEAVTFLNKYISNYDDNSWSAYMEIGNAYFDDEKLEEAKINYEKALEISPDNGTVLHYYNQLKEQMSNKQKQSGN